MYFRFTYSNHIGYICQYIIHSLTVHGKWSSWGAYSTCTQTCGGGTQFRTRSCTNPTPAYDGYACDVDGSSDTDLIICNPSTCCEYSN